MKLIDADALPNELFKKHVHDGEELEPMLYFEDAVKVVENAPTIDAIPVEWLKQKRNGQSSPWDYLANAIDYILAVYKKEQEAQDEPKV